MRKPVVLITGAGGEIGHGLVTRLAGAGIADHHARRQPARRVAGAAGATRVHRVDHRRRPARSHARGVRGRARLPPRGAALDAVGVHAGDGASRQRRGHAQPARVRAARRASRTAGRCCSSIRRRSPPTACPSLETKMRAGAVTEDQFAHADDDVRVQQAVLRAARTLLRDSTTSSCRPTRSAAVDFRCVRFPG